MTSVKSISRLVIWKSGVKCGYLHRRQDGGAEFTYDSQYLADPQSRDLCFNMKKRSEPYIQYGSNLHPYFAGLLPEGLRLKVLLEKIKTSPDDLFSLFTSLGTDCIGDVFAKADDQPNKGQAKKDLLAAPRWNEINFYDFFLSTLKNPNIMHQSDFAGVQEKISASMISLPFSTKRGGAYILKLNPKDKKNLVYNEWACLSLAQLCGIDVNEFEIINDRDGEEGLLVKRFDRQSLNRQMIPIHQEDICQALNVFPSEKYRLSLKEIFLCVQSRTTAPTVELPNLLRQVVFSYLIGNGDLHAKNISLFMSPTDGTVALTPAYDLICTLIYGDQKMALRMDAKDSNLKRQDFIGFALRFGLNPNAIEVLLDELLHRFHIHHGSLFSIPATENRLNFLAQEIARRIQMLS